MLRGYQHRKEAQEIAHAGARAKLVQTLRAPREYRRGDRTRGIDRCARISISPGSRMRLRHNVRNSTYLCWMPLVTSRNPAR